MPGVKPLCGLVLVVAGCTGFVEDPEPPSDPAESPPALEYAPDEPEVEPPILRDVAVELRRDDVLLQVDFQPTFVGIDLVDPFPPYGRVPEVTLYADGTIIYDPAGTVVVAEIGAERARGIHTRALDAGAERLRGYTDNCHPSGWCSADGAIVLLRVRHRNGRVVETRHYGGWAPANQAAFDEVYHCLTELAAEDHDTQDYRPGGATLFLDKRDKPLGVLARPWRLAQPLPRDGRQRFVYALTRADLDAIDDDQGRVAFRDDGETYVGVIVPWLPGMDFTKAIARDSPSGRWR